MASGEVDRVGGGMEVRCGYGGMGVWGMGGGKGLDKGEFGCHGDD